MKQITFQDLMDCDKIQNPHLQQLFLLSRYFNIPEEDIKNMPVDKFMSLMNEMNEYLEDSIPQIPTVDVKKFSPSFSTSTSFIKNRFDILDI